MKKLKKQCFPDVSESPRTLKKKRIEREDQKYAASFIEDSKTQKTKDNRSGSIRDRLSQSKYIGSNDDLNSSMKREIDPSNLSSPHDSSSNISPVKPDHRIEMSRRVDSNDSENRNSTRNNSKARPSTQYRKDSNDRNEKLSIKEKL